MLTNDNIRIIIPNSELIAGRVINWSYGTHQVRLRIPVDVSHRSDIHLVQKLLLEIAAANENVLKNPAPAVNFLAFGEDSLKFELRVWTSELPGISRKTEKPVEFCDLGKVPGAQYRDSFPAA